MSADRNTQVSPSDTDRAKVWLLPDQVDRLRDAAQERSRPHLALRNEVLVTLLYDTGLRRDELRHVDTSMLDLGGDRPTLYLPGPIQKDYPHEGTPDAATLELGKYGVDDSPRLLKTYLNARWKDTEALLPSQRSDRMSGEQMANVTKKLAEYADVRPVKVDGSRGDADDVTPHALRHSVAYRMLHEHDARIYDVRNRLRHTSVQTTEQVYEHFVVR